MKRMFELVLVAAFAVPVAATGANGQAQPNETKPKTRQPQTVVVISPQEVAAALKQSGYNPPQHPDSMLVVPVDRHNVIGVKPKPVKNPYAGNPNALVQGKKLYKSLNCAVCHGLKGGGGQGEQLNNGHWRYGGEPADIYLSISHGRPAGMPAWGTALPPQAIWELVTYVETLPKNNPGHPHQTPPGLENKGRQAPIIRTFGQPASPKSKGPQPPPSSSQPGARR